MDIKSKIFSIDIIKQYYGENRELVNYLDKVEKSLHNAIDTGINLSLVAYLFSGKNLQQGVICDEIIGYPPMPIRHVIHANIITTEIEKYVKEVVSNEIESYFQLQRQQNIYAYPTNLYSNNSL